MNLTEYVKSSPGAGSRMASALGISPSYLSQMSTGHRPIPVITAVRIEDLTDGAVRRWDLFPIDWHRIWPELVSAEGAPPVPAAPAAEQQEAA